MIVTGGLGVRCGALPLRGMGGNAAGASYPIRTSRREWWFPYNPEKFDEAKKLAAELKGATDRLRFMPHDSVQRKVFEKIAAPYRLVVPGNDDLARAKLDLLEMALDPQTTEDILALLQWADEDEMELLFS